MAELQEAGGPVGCACGCSLSTTTEQLPPSVVDTPHLQALAEVGVTTLRFWAESSCHSRLIHFS